MSNSVKPKALPAHSPEQKRFATNAKKLLRDVAAHVADGGDVLTHGDIELKLYKRRDALYPLLRKLGLSEDPVSIALHDRVTEEMRGFRDRAAENRKRGYDAEIDRLKKLEREADAKLTSYDREIRAMGRKR